MNGDNHYDLERLTATLTRHEGEAKFPYLCTAGKTSIGIGRNLTDKGISQATIEQMFDEDLNEAISDVAAVFPRWTELSPIRQEVLINMAFNLGRVKLAGFKNFFKALSLAVDANPEEDQAAYFYAAGVEMEDSAWWGQVGPRAPELREMMEKNEAKK